jgi:hypothetical protein
MLQAHSFLWHYLWVAPNVYLLILAFFLWKRGIAGKIPAFALFAVLAGAGQLVVYLADILAGAAPSFVSPVTFWRIDWADLGLEAVLKFAVIGEVFALVCGGYASVSKLGKSCIRGAGVLLVFAAVFAAAYAGKSEHVAIIAGANLLEQSTYIVETGVLVFVFAFASYFHLSWPRRILGITLGLSISACVHLATWALIDNGGFSHATRLLFVFVNMITFHFCVLLWFYYLILSHEEHRQTPVSVTENNLAAWNRELERLLQQ